jgi:DNA invertase Pin-like site-specific DNA recombinase
VRGQEGRFIVDSREALRAMIRDIKAGKVDHLLR